MMRLSDSKTFSHYTVFVIEECHMLSSKLWSRFVKFLRNPLPRVVFIFLTTDPEQLRQTILSPCQRYIFHKIKDADIVSRLRKISVEEDLEIESEALDEIARISDGSVRDAEEILDQLSLQGKKITMSLVYDVVGVVSNEKLLDLLDAALSSGTAETVNKSRELMDSGVDPVTVISQLKRFIIDIIAGRNHLQSSHRRRNFSWQNLAEAELRSLQQALDILSDAEKQFKFSSGRSTLFIAALLQLASASRQKQTLSEHFKEHTSSKMSACGSNMSLATPESSSSSIAYIDRQYSSPIGYPFDSLPKRGNIPDFPPASNIYAVSQKENAATNWLSGDASPDKLDEIWRRCRSSHPMTRELFTHGKLVSIEETNGDFIANIVFEDSNLKSSAEDLLSSIKESIERVLWHSVEVRIGLIQENYSRTPESLLDSLHNKQMEKVVYDRLIDTDIDRYIAKPRLPQSMLHRTNGAFTRESRLEIGEQNEPTLEKAWLQAEEEGATELARRSKLNNQILRQNAVNGRNHKKCMSLSMEFGKNDFHQENVESSIVNGQGHSKELDAEGVKHHYTISPSLLHSNSYRDKSEQSNTYVPLCGLPCWKNSKGKRAKDPVKLRCCPKPKFS